MYARRSLRPQREGGLGRLTLQSLQKPQCGQSARVLGTQPMPPAGQRWRTVLWSALLVLLMASAVALILHRNHSSHELLLLCGSGMRRPMLEIAAAFEEQTGTHVVVLFGGSSTLRRYVLAYGDADLFISGDDENIALLDRKGLVSRSAFVAWHVPGVLVPQDRSRRIRSLDDLAGEGVRIVQSNPVQASLGMLVHSALMRHPRGQQIASNVVVYGASTQDDLRKFWSLYREGKADAVIEWDVMACTAEGRGLHVVPFPQAYVTRNSVTLAQLSGSERPELAQRFFDYVDGNAGRAVFRRHCYDIERRR